MNKQYTDILSKLQKIEEKLDIINKETNRMEHHIDFVENVYDNIKYPFHFIMNKVSNVSNVSNGSNASNVTYKKFGYSSYLGLKK